jgi:hypothetical protein
VNVRTALFFVGLTLLGGCGSCSTDDASKSSAPAPRPADTSAVKVKVMPRPKAIVRSDAGAP